ncbi:AMP-binding protein [Chitinophaga sp. Cy-1792]|uniref:AMP-binding protein n=1 Tax=Chitinophaga sp. Cy-1792 TaxID=2608339 RepID=UPI0014227158|nr:AMP-binding protein [Chitinophaga sp. Cy-1792]NIG54644.1 AMP-binding protein [Chitinophaga sp. Cy-1792]
MHISKKSIIDHLIFHARSCPDKTVFSFTRNGLDITRQISYCDLYASVETLARQLSERQLYGKRALLVFQDIASFIVSFLACQYAGVIPVPVSYGKGSRQYSRLKSIAADADAAVVLCTMAISSHLEKEMGSFLAASQINVVVTEYEPPVGTPGNPAAQVIHPVAFIQYTSGSTGQPKGVIVSHENLLHNQQLITAAFGCDTTSIIFSWLPFHHDMGLIGNILHTIYTGCTAVLMSPFDFMQSPERWIEGVSRHKATHSGGPNFAFDLCVSKVAPERMQQLDLSCWKSAFNGSEPVRFDTMQRFTTYFSAANFRAEAFHPCYGLAEATLLVAGVPPAPERQVIFIKKEQDRIHLAEQQDTAASPVVGAGRIPEGMHVQIMDEGGQPCSTLQEGEICIHGKSVTAGYWNQDNSDIFYQVDGVSYLRTGDLGFLFEDTLYISGRAKEMLIVRGRNIYPYDLEKAIAENTVAIENNGVALFSREEGSEEMIVVAEIKRSSARALDVPLVLASIRNTITGMTGLTLYDIVLTTPLGIPRTTSGKLQRLKCREYYQQQLFNVLASVRETPVVVAIERDPLLLEAVFQHPDKDNIKRYVLDLVANRLGQHVAATDEMVELTSVGLDSLRAMEMMNVLCRELHIQLDVALVLQENSLQQLVGAIENLLWLKNEKTSGKEITI